MAFAGKERLCNGIPEKHRRVAADLAVELVSPNDNYDDVEEKGNRYFGAGVQNVWVVTTPITSARVLRSDGAGADHRYDNEIAGEDVLPGFRCGASELFADPLAEPQS